MNHSVIRNNRTTFDEKMLLLLDKPLKEETARIAQMNHMTANAFVREALRRNIKEIGRAHV